MDYSTIVIITALTVVGGTEAKRLSKGQPLTVSPVLAGFMVGLVLFVIGLLNESLATKFCVLVIVGSVLYNGTALVTTLTPKTTK